MRLGADPDRLYTVPQAAEALNVTQAAVRRWIFERRLTVVKIGSAVRIEETELTRLMEAGRDRPPTSLCPATVRPAGVTRDGADLGERGGDDR
jgi:excisionase family DNA binding protein